MNHSRHIRLATLVLALGALYGCATNPFGRTDRHRPPSDQEVSEPASDTIRPPVCALSEDCGGTQKPTGRPPEALTYSTQVRKQLEAIAGALALTPKQTVLWDNYMAKLNALINDQSNPDQNLTSLDSAPRQIRRKLDIARDRYTATEDIADAALKLYQSLGDDQKRTADRLLPSIVPMLYASLGNTTPVTGATTTRDAPDQSMRNSGNNHRRSGSGSWGGGSGSAF